MNHGGLQSIVETVYHGVPLVGIPMFGDHFMNTMRSADDGFAIHLPYEDLTENSLTHAITELINNTR